MKTTVDKVLDKFTSKYRDLGASKNIEGTYKIYSTTIKNCEARMHTSSDGSYNMTICDSSCDPVFSVDLKLTDHSYNYFLQVWNSIKNSHLSNRKPVYYFNNISDFEKLNLYIKGALD